MGLISKLTGMLACSMDVEHLLRATMCEPVWEEAGVLYTWDGVK